MEAKAVQSVGVGCGFDERRHRGDDGHSQDQRGKRCPEKTISKKVFNKLGGPDLSKINTGALRGVCRCFSGVH